MLKEIKRRVEEYFSPESVRLRIKAQEEYQKYASEAVWDAEGRRWGRHGEEIRM